MMMHTENISYFKQGGNMNFPSVITITKGYLEKNPEIKNIAVFAGNINSVMSLYDALKDSDVTITVTTYAYGREFYKTASEGEEREVVKPEVANKESKAKILECGMNYVQGGLPFEPIRSCTGDNALEMIVSTFDIISKGLTHCVSAAIMAKENGYIDDGEKILALSGDTAVVVTPTLRRDLFTDNFKIHKILCKPC